MPTKQATLVWSAEYHWKFKHMVSRFFMGVFTDRGPVGGAHVRNLIGQLRTGGTEPTQFEINVVCKSWKRRLELLSHYNTGEDRLQV